MAGSRFLNTDSGTSTGQCLGIVAFLWRMTFAHFRQLDHLPKG
jgi:hypothetical protein